MNQLFLLLTCLMISTSALAGTVEDLKNAVINLANEDYLQPGRLGVYVQEVTSGKVLVSRNGDETMLPASTMKVVTGAVAMDILGIDYTFKTRIRTTGKIENGVLQGNIVIVGGGDPTLGSDRFGVQTRLEYFLTAAVTALQKKGISKIEGRVIGDASAYGSSQIPVNWVWNDIGNYYGAGASGLSILENTYKIWFKPSETVGKTAELLRTSPELPGVTFINEMETGRKGSGDQGYIYGAPYSNIRFLRGSIPQGKAEFAIKGSLPDPAHTAAQLLTDALETTGIPVSGSPTTRRQLAPDAYSLANSQVVYTHTSPALRDIIYWMEKKSINLFAEHLVKEIGKKVNQDPSTESGLKAIAAHLRNNKIPMAGMHLHDGSGLSRYNGITAHQLVALLRYSHFRLWNTAFYESLPIAGNTADPGTLRRMCRNTVAANNVHAKSGSIARVRAYAGYVDTRSGKRLAFALIANNFTSPSRTIRDRFAELMVKMAELP